jgi:hypothetical protein
MSYGVVVSPRANEFVRQLPFDLAELVWDHIELLLEDPVNRSRRAAAPRTAGQAFDFVTTLDDREYAFRIFFRFLDTADENQIHITYIEMWADE